MDLAPLSLEHKPILDPFFKALCLKYDLLFSEYSFANCYLFRKKHQYKVALCDTPCLQGVFANGHHYYIPSKSAKELKFTLPKMADCGIYSCFYPLKEEWKEDFISLGLQLDYSDADSDYLFTSEKFKTLAGRKLSSRRNLLNQFESHHVVTAKNLNEVDKNVLIAILDKWQLNTAQSKEDTDYKACLEAIELYEILNLFGRVVYAGDEPVGFTIGEILTPKLAIIHFAKSLKEVKGITPYLYRDFALNLPSQIEWINIEQDLGDLSLRQAKKAYDPDLLLTKWKACY